MAKRITTALLALAVGASGCIDLQGPKLANDPNKPTQADNVALFVAAQANMNVLQEGHLARAICIWHQQCAGLAQQYVGLAVYQVTEDEFFNQWTQVYTGGGLLDLRRIQSAALASGDSAFAGVSLVYEAWLVGIAADVWGDVPYSQAVGSAQAPALDGQMAVYDAIEAKLDTAIIDLSSAGTKSVGPLAADLTYDGDLSKWIKLAQTLKARFYLHTAEVRGQPAYQAALTAAQGGLASPADDYIAYHGSSSNESNLWHQFLGAWQGYIGPGSFLVDTIMDQVVDTVIVQGVPVPMGDPRLPVYFDTVRVGTDSGKLVGGVNGVDHDNAPSISPFSSVRVAPDFRQPFVTWAENQLIIAEAAYQTANPALALTSLEASRADAGLAPLNPAPSGAALLQAIMTEKYIRTFQSMEVWNDYKRTCLPHLTPVAGATAIPARMVYPLSERVANPSIPDQGPLQNPNDPNPCP